MGVLLNFDFLAILNLFVLLLWPSFVPLVAATDKRSAINIIMIIVTVIVIFGDIVFLVLKMTGHS